MDRKECLNCQTLFKPRRTYHLFCTAKCRDSHNVGKSWPNYFRKLIQKTPLRKKLHPGQLVKLLEKQGGLCALTGVQLTKVQGNGTVTTNASIDRIRAGGAYTLRNIRLVCSFVNSFRGNVTDKELKWWAKRIVDYA